MFKQQIEDFKAQIATKKAEAQAFAKLAKEEDRDLTEEENASVDNIIDVVIPKLVASLERSEKLLAFCPDTPRPNDPSRIIDLEKEHSKIIVPASAKRHGKLKSFTGPTAEEDAYTTGRFLLATIGGHEDSAVWCRDHGIQTVKNVMTTTDNQLGGFTIPNPMEVGIIALREQYGVFRRNAFVEPMISDTKSISRPVGGIVAYFTGEGVTGTESDSQWKNINLVAQKIMALARMSKELSVDSVVSIADQVTRDVAYAFALKEDQCGFLGDATSTYGGITGLINALLASSQYTAITGNTAFSTLDLADFETMVGMLPQYAEAGAKWYISKPAFMASMARLADAAGGNTKSDIAGMAERQFLGYPVEIVQVMNSTLTAQTSTSGLCYFGDLAMAATLADRTGMSIETSDQVYFTSDQIAIKGTERFGINVHEVGAATGAAGPIVMLKTPGS